MVRTLDGRVVTGLTAESSDATVTIQTQNERVLLSKDEIESAELTPVSMMPEGLLDPLKETEVRDLIAYLTSPVQVPLPDGGGQEPTDSIPGNGGKAP